MRERDTQATRAWLARCLGTGFAHGSDLVDWIGRECEPDNVHQAEVLLKTWEERGWIVGGPPTPTVSQQVMGQGGLWWPAHIKAGCVPRTFRGWSRTPGAPTPQWEDPPEDPRDHYIQAARRSRR